MSREYLIGEVAEILGIGKQSIRRYAENGLVEIKQDEETGYRYFDLGSFNVLMRIVFLRNAGFTMKDIARVLNTNDMTVLDDMLAQRRRELKKEKERISLIEKRMHEIQTRLDSIEYNQLEEVISPDFYYIQYCEQRKLINHGKDNTIIHHWVDEMPITNSSPSFFMKNGVFEKRCDYGLVIEADHVYDKAIIDHPLVRHYPPQQSIHGFVKCDVKHPLELSTVQQFIDEAERRGLKAERIIGKTLMTYNQLENRTRVHEMWAMCRKD
ncbi:MAG: MerR family transcriptional regulator [Solobacterium sp.]|jgi:DNA-binding transcriptional MerR regulator|nr:MerR family transcriptional regulator [Solobacterium sp.]MCH4266010.1 MerR family transcriptional regulator [Solobacterium sp.]